MDKIDLLKANKAEYAAPKKPVLVDIKPAQYLAISGIGAPGGEEFASRIGALYGMAYTIKMTRKFEGREDYTICKLETQYWCKQNDPDFPSVPKDQWRWKLLIRTPEFIKPSDLKCAAEKLKSKDKGHHVDDVKLETLTEGPCVQMLHVGPYEREEETVNLMYKFAQEQGRRFHGFHHEIYLSDPRRVPPERLKTILRHPVK